ncbi:MAG: tetratricopeptide repeat protein, partial [Aureliella sp.]
MHRLTLAGFAVLFVALASCQRSSVDEADSKAVKTNDVSGVAAVDANLSSPPQDQPLQEQPSDQREPPIHPIDAIAEGKRYRLATAALDRGDFETAEAIRKELTNSAQYHSLASAIQALIWIKQGKHAEALKAAEEISAIEIMQAEAYVLAGEIFLRENRLAEATDAFQEALARNSRHARAHRWLGVLYYDTGAMRLA